VKKLAECRLAFENHGLTPSKVKDSSDLMQVLVTQEDKNRGLDFVKSL
jgi:hypothetical protein